MTRSRGVAQLRRSLQTAYAHVRTRDGGPGADGMRLEDFARHESDEINRLAFLVHSDRYVPYPLLRVEIPKASGGIRGLAIPTVRDRVVQTAVHLRHRDRFDREFEPCSFGYRPHRSVRQAVQAIRKLRREGYTWVVDTDIESYFDHIPHVPLLERIALLNLGPRVETLLAQWLQAEVYDGHTVTRLTCGVPQGTVIGPLLANLYLDQMDEILLRRGLALVRYADDFVVLCRTRDDAERALELTTEIVESLHLHLKQSKTRIVSFTEGFRFLGVDFLQHGALQRLDDPAPAAEAPRPRSYPPPLDLWRYLELSQSGPFCRRPA